VEPALADFLRGRRPGAETSETWSRADWSPIALTFAIRCYLDEALPPLDFITSVRCLLLREEEVMVVRDPRVYHLLPGGHRNAGETLEETLRREVLEETGWTVAEPALLGFMHFHHLGPRPPGYRYPHPDFLQLVYTSGAGRFIPGARLTDDYELEASWRPVAECASLVLSPADWFYLAASLARPARPG
jgi:8-oxo-dGTP pyrophosphatase MutT (NUDIX family)